MDTTFRDHPVESLPCEAGNAVGDGLKTVQLVPDGVTESTNGRFTVDAEAAALMVEGFDRHGVELVIDFEHQTLGGEYAAPDGRAPAAGWITKIWYERDRGVLALVRWNPKTRDAIREGAYGYLSPVLIVRKTDGKAVGLHSVALTNRPAIPRLSRLAASQNTNAETKAMADGTMMDVSAVLGKIAGLLKIEVKGEATALLSAIRDKIKALVAGEGEAAIAQSVRSLLELSPTADKNEVVVPEKSSRSRYLLHEMRRSSGYTLQEPQGVWVKTLQNRNGFHAAQASGTRCV